MEDVLGVEEASGTVLFSACGVNKDENPYQMHTYRVNLNGGPLQQLDMADMDVLSTASDDARYCGQLFPRGLRACGRCSA